MIYADIFGRKYSEDDLNDLEPGWFECLGFHISEKDYLT